jgi:hypothetical protein
MVFFEHIKAYAKNFLVIIIFNSKFCLLVPALFYGEPGAVGFCSFEFRDFLFRYEMSTGK